MIKKISGKDFMIFIYLIIMSNIRSLNPPYNSTISLGTNSLKLIYNTTVILSAGNITIYQVYGTDGADVIMRQSTSGLTKEFCSFDPGLNEITLKVLSSTF